VFPLRDTIPRRTPPIANGLIIFVNTVVFLFELVLPESVREALFFQFGLVPSHVMDSDFTLQTLYPFVTNMFLHGGWGHFLSNMWTLWIFGDNVEDRMGSLRYVLFYLLCGVIASFTHFVLYSTSSVPAIGASGAISGVMGAYMFLFPHSRIIFFVPLLFLPYFIELSAFFYIGFWFLGQLWSGTVSLTVNPEGAGIAFWAHIGGFLGGILLYRLFLIGKRKFYYEDSEYDEFYEYF
jgi:membrane associated rhomboid family serine protease